MWSDIDQRIQTRSLGKIGSSLSSYLYILRAADIARPASEIEPTFNIDDVRPVRNTLRTGVAVALVL